MKIKGHIQLMLGLTDLEEIGMFLGGFVIVAVAARQLSAYFKKVHLPAITGLLLVGLLSGPFVFRLLSRESVNNLHFLNDVALAFIAFAAGSELFLKEMRGRFKSIKWMTFGQLVVTFVLGAFAVMLLASEIPFMQPMPLHGRFAVALLFSTIFVARSPASAIAVINELRAKGPFTKTVMGVTVIKDVLVIVLFAVCMSLADVLLNNGTFSLGFLGILLAEIAGSILLGVLLGKLVEWTLALKTHAYVKTTIILLLGYAVFPGSVWLKQWSDMNWGVEFHLEPLLAAIVGSFMVNNYSRHRLEFVKIIQEVGPTVYVVFFTLTGASLSIDLLLQAWSVAIVLFAVRLVALFLGGMVGGYFGGDPVRHNLIAWMPYVTQAGVGLGLAMLVAQEYPAWGGQFATVIIAVIVLNQVAGPPLFKWALGYVGEDHSRADVQTFDGHRDCIIFGLENQSIALAQQLEQNGWQVKIATRLEEYSHFAGQQIQIVELPELSYEAMESIGAGKAEAIVLMLSDAENYQICELAYEHFGTKDMVVRLHSRRYFDPFHKLGALIVEPSTAIVSLLDHFVRSPHATSLLLGMNKNQDTIELEIRNEELHGMALRNLRLPPDVIILSVARAGQMLISHGYTRLRMGDMVTLVGTKSSLDTVRLRFEGV